MPGPVQYANFIGRSQADRLLGRFRFTPISPQVRLGGVSCLWSWHRQASRDTSLRVPAPLAPEILGQLIGLLAHDLRNPLSALHSNVGFLESVIESADEDVEEALRDARVSCDGLMYIIDNMELIGRSLVDPPGLPTTRIGLMPVLLEVVTRHRPLAKSHGVTLELEDVPASIRVVSHKDMLVRAAGNLVRNGIQHGPPGGAVRIRVRHDADDACLICVEDSGPALSPELTERAFEAEAQLDLKSATGGRYSRGLGLYAARLAAHAIGGEVRAGPRTGKGGSSLELRIPAG